VSILVQKDPPNLKCQAYHSGSRSPILFSANFHSHHRLCADENWIWLLLCSHWWRCTISRLQKCLLLSAWHVLRMRFA